MGAGKGPMACSWKALRNLRAPTRHLKTLGSRKSGFPAQPQHPSASENLMIKKELSHQVLAKSLNILLIIGLPKRELSL